MEDKYEFRGPMLTKVNAAPQPKVTEEVKQWGDLVGWLRATGLSPEEVRSIVQDAQKEQECLSAELTSKQQD